MQEAVLYLMQAAFLLYRVIDLTGEERQQDKAYGKAPVEKRLIAICYFLK